MTKADLTFLFFLSDLACTYAACGGNKKIYQSAKEQRNKLLGLMFKKEK